MSGRDRPVVGQIFYVPLYEGGYAFGYITLIDKQAGTLCNFFSLVSEKSDVPDDIAGHNIALHDLLVGGAEFARSKHVGTMQWKITPHHMPGTVAPKCGLFIMQSRPVYKLVDLTTNVTRPATQDEIERYPTLSFAHPLFMTKIVEKAVRHLDIDPNLIGVDRAEGTVH
jgi:hypothetical protein